MNLYQNSTAERLLSKIMTAKVEGEEIRTEYSAPEYLEER